MRGRRPEAQRANRMPCVTNWPESCVTLTLLYGVALFKQKVNTRYPLFVKWERYGVTVSPVSAPTANTVRSPSRLQRAVMALTSQAGEIHASPGIAQLSVASGSVRRCPRATTRVGHLWSPGRRILGSNRRALNDGP
jgi:hypothetical protein